MFWIYHLLYENNFSFHALFFLWGKFWAVEQFIYHLACNKLSGKMLMRVSTLRSSVHNTYIPLISSVAQSCLTLCDPMNRRVPGTPVHHQLPEFTQTHVHRVSEDIQPSHPLSSPSSIRVFSNESALHMKWPKYWSFSFSISPSSEHPGLISFRMDWLHLLAVQGTLKSLLQHHSPKASIHAQLSL